MPRKSSPRWAFGAVGLTVLLACSPDVADQDATLAPAPEAPVASDTPPPLPPVTAETPGFVGLWAESVDACSEPDTGITLTADRIDMPVEKRSCAITSIEEEHPSGRAMNYVVQASCATQGAPAPATFRFEFGAADTIMQLKIDGASPMRLERCPSIATP